MIIAILLVLVVLAQNSKGGVSSEFGGSATSQVMGVKKTGDFLERLTWGFIIALVLLTLSTYLLREKTSIDTTGGTLSPNVEKAQETTNIPVFEDVDSDLPEQPASSDENID